MTADFITPGFIGAILVAIAVEAVAIYIFVPGLRRAADVWLTLLSGAALMAAVGIALAGGERLCIATALAASLITHLLYLWTRLAPRKDARIRK